MLADLPMDDLRGLLGPDFSANLLVAVSSCAPIAAPQPEQVDRFLGHHLIKVGWKPWPTFDPQRLTLIDRATAERYLIVVLQRDLAYGEERLPL